MLAMYTLDYGAVVQLHHNDRGYHILVLNDGQVTHISNEATHELALHVFLAWCVENHGPVDINILNEEDTGPVSY